MEEGQRGRHEKTLKDFLVVIYLLVYSASYPWKKNDRNRVRNYLEGFVVQ